MVLHLLDAAGHHMLYFFVGHFDVRIAKHTKADKTIEKSKMRIFDLVLHLRKIAISFKNYAK